MGVWENIQFSLPLPLFFFIRHSRAVLPVWWVEAHPSGLGPKVRRVMGQAGGLGGGPRASPLPTPPRVLPQEAFEFTFFSFRICCGLFEVCLQVFAGLFLDSWELFVFCSLLYYSFAEKNLKQPLLALLKGCKAKVCSQLWGECPHHHFLCYCFSHKEASPPGEGESFS